MGDCLETTQSEIARSARNDSIDRVITQTPGERAVGSNCTVGVLRKIVELLKPKGGGNGSLWTSGARLKGRAGF